VIDTKARPDEDDCKAMIRAASLIVIPTTTSGDDLRVSAQTARLLAQAGSKIHRILLTKVLPQAGTVEISEAKKYLTAQGVPVFKHWIRQYKAYQHAFLEGVPVYEVKHPKAADAWADYRAAVEEIFNGN
jgi:chromosome partitioning protein